MTAPATRRSLSFATPADALAEIARLRRGYVKTANWSLPQMSHHLAELMELAKDDPPTGDPTPEQAAMQAGFVDPLLAGGPMPQGGENNPPADSGDDQIDRLEAAFRKLDAYPHDRITNDFLGPMPIDKWRRLCLIHAAHHLGFLVPTATASS